MFKLFCALEWFSGYDLIFQAIGLVVVLLIAAYSWKVYRMTSENKYGYFSFAFILIGVGLLLNMLTQGLLCYSSLRKVATSVLVPLVGAGAEGINYQDLFFRSGVLLNMITMLGAWLLIFFVSQKKSGRLQSYYEVSQIALFVYLVVLISIVSNFKYFVFYLTSTVILGMTVLNYYKNYLNTNKSKNAYLVMSSFFLILIGNFFFVFVFLKTNLYVFGEMFLLAGFLLLLYTYRKITKVRY